MNKKQESQQLKLLNHMYRKHYKSLIDKLKVHLLDSLIGLADKKEGKIIFKEELIIIKEGVEEQRNKEKEMELNSLKGVIESLMGRFGTESKDFAKEEKADE